MAWTTPRTWVNLEVVSHTTMNTHVRDNLQYLKDIEDGVQGQDRIWARGTTDAQPTTMTVRKARGSIGTPSAVSANDFVLDLRSAAYNAAGYRDVALIRSWVAVVGATNVTGVLDFYTFRSSDGVGEHGLRITGGVAGHADGSVSLPGINFYNDSDTGIYRNGADEMRLVTGGVNHLNLTRSGGVLFMGFYGATTGAKPTITGSRAGNAALASLLTELATLGLVTNSSTA